MSAFMQRRTLRELSTPAEVFEECLLDIRDGLWVCGKLSDHNTACTHVEKPMGCAIGLIGINTGNCTWELQRDAHNEFMIVETWKEEEAQYWNPLAQDSMIILAKALLTIHEYRRENYISDHDLYDYNNVDENGEGKPYELKQVLATLDGNASTASDLIVDYNDSGIKKDEADAWFSKALEMAQQGQ